MAPVVAAALISGAVNLLKTGGDLYSKNKASDAAQQGIQYQEDKDGIINQEESRLQNWYDRNYNADTTQRADAQSLLNYTAEQIKKRNKAAAGTQAVMGGTEESVAAEKQANSSAMAETASRIAAAGASRKDNIDKTYLQGMQGIANQRLGQKDKMSDLELQRAGQISSAGSALGGLNIDVGSIVKSFSGSGD
ncbi:MAG: hypothetical protein IJP80_04895 [Bacteroidales bacterium]|nr:hypothetical protein [Bacteroidales bacterium]